MFENKSDMNGRRHLLALSLVLSLCMPVSAQPVVVETAEVFTAQERDAVGIPQNNGAFWDGSQYWLLYADGGTLRAKHGETLASLRDTPTHPTHPSGTADISGLVNNKTFSVVFGRWEDGWRAWAVLNRTGDRGGESAIAMYRWDLDAEGLRNGEVRPLAISDKPEPSHASLMPAGENFDVSTLYACVTTGGSPQGNNTTASRRVAPDLAEDVGLGGLTMSGVRFPEAAWVFAVEDGLVQTQINVGDWGTPRSPRDSGFSQWTRSTDASGWGEEGVLEHGKGAWGDMNYARGTTTSHAGQTDFVQLADGRIFNAYIDDADAERGYFGRIVLRVRGDHLDAAWSLVTPDAVGEESSAWHLALTSDGTDVYLLYIEDNGRVRDNAVYLRRYQTSKRELDDEVKVADVTPGRTFERMTTQWRFTDTRLVLLWSEFDDATGTLHAHATAVDVAPDPVVPGLSE